MNCTIDIKREGNAVLAYLPFNPRAEFGILKGSIYVNCIISGAAFKTKLMSRGNEGYCLFFSRQLLKNLGLQGEEHLNVQLEIEPDSENAAELAEPTLPENETIKAIRERASIRTFSNQEISALQIDTIVNAGLCAPSATNKRPFHYIVTQSKEGMARIAQNNPYARMLPSATACIIVCGDKVVQGIPEWLIEDCSAATQNMLLAIHSLGLGGVWCGVKQGSDFYKNIVSEFALPSHIRPVSLVAFGHTDAKKLQPNRQEAGKIHREVW